MKGKEAGATFQPGDQVVHPKFGEGVVTQVSDRASTNGAGEQTWQVTVNFAVGEKRVVSSFIKLKREVHRIDRLREAVRDYGQLSVETDQMLRRLGGTVQLVLRPYLHREKMLVHGVPPQGPWEPETDYRDAAFSTYSRATLTLDPLEMGLAVRVDNLGDDGALWIRIVLTMAKAGDRLLVSIGDDKPIELPIAFESKLTPVCDMIFERLLKLYTQDVQHNRSGYYGTTGPIGFVTSRN